MRGARLAARLHLAQQVLGRLPLAARPAPLLEDEGLECGAINFTCYRGRTRHAAKGWGKSYKLTDGDGPFLPCCAPSMKPMLPDC